MESSRSESNPNSEEAIFRSFTFEVSTSNRFGYLAGEASWVLEDNEAMNKPWKDLGAPLYRRWRIYEKELT